MNNTKQNWIIYSIVTVVSLFLSVKIIEFINAPKKSVPLLKQERWIAPSLFTDRTIQGEERALVIYGEELIANTSKYMGPNGSVAKITNGMNCQNCHLSAGKKIGETTMVLSLPTIQSFATGVVRLRPYTSV